MVVVLDLYLASLAELDIEQDSVLDIGQDSVRMELLDVLVFHLCLCRSKGHRSFYIPYCCYQGIDDKLQNVSPFHTDRCWNNFPLILLCMLKMQSKHYRVRILSIKI